MNFSILKKLEIVGKTGKQTKPRIISYKLKFVESRKFMVSSQLLIAQD